MKPCGFVIYDTKTKCYYNGFRIDEPNLQAVRARFERPEGAQKEVTRQQSGGYETPENLVIIPVSMIMGDPIKPKIAKQKQGFVIKIVEHIPAVKMWNRKAYDRTSFYKGNKKKLPETVKEIRTKLDAYAEERRLCNRNEQYEKDGRQQTALSSAQYNWSRARVETEVRATIFPSREAAQRHLDVHNANLDQYYKEYAPRPHDNHRDLKTERQQFTVTIEEVK